MALSARHRWLILGSLLVLTLVLALWPQKAPREPAPRPPAAAKAPAAGQGRPPADTGSLGLSRGQQGTEPREIRDLFAGQTWHVPPPAAPPGPPEPPPLPFTYLGKLVDDGRVTVYLSEGERNLAVRQGEIINGTYRVKRISPTAVTFVYIPMNKQQTLDIGRAQ